MANLVVSNRCNMRCSYCFARDYLTAPQQDEDFISLEQFEQRLDFLQRSGMEDVRLIGGEPSLHPRFPELIERAARRFPRIVVFSNGMMSQPALDALDALPLERLTVLVNLTTGRSDGSLSEGETVQHLRTLRRLGERVIGAATLATVDFNLEPLLPLVLENGCRKAIRLGMAQPVFGGNNTALHPKQYPLVGRRIAAFAEKAAQAGVRVEFDCGFVRCMFSEPDFEKLEAAGAFTESRCSPVLDIDLHGEVSHCFPLAGSFALSLTPESTAAGLCAEFLKKTAPFRQAGIYKECSACAFKGRGECTGGCLSGTLNRFQTASFQFTCEAAANALPQD